VIEKKLAKFPTGLKPDIYGRPQIWNKGQRDRRWNYQYGVILTRNSFCSADGRLFDARCRPCHIGFHRRDSELKHLWESMLWGVRVNENLFSDNLPLFRNTVVNLCQSNDKVYGHFLLEVIPRLSLFQSLDLSDRDQKFYVGNLAPQMLTALECMGVNRDQIITAVEFPVLEAACIYTPVFHMGSRIAFPKFLINSLKRLKKNFHLANSFQEDKIYVARRDPKLKRANDGKLITELERIGFDILYPEDHSFEQQVKIFDRAKVVVGPHGSGLFNVAFCQPGTKVIDIFPAANNSNLFRLSHAMGHDYKVVKFPSGNPANWSMKCDFDIDTNLIMEVLKTAEAI
jgi:capsular polysaccharide biosynthesis protein